MKQMNLCIQEGCNKPVAVKKRGLCRSHYHVWVTENKPNGKKPCTYEGCKGFTYAKGYCKSHYAKYRRGTLNKFKPLCECGKPVVGRGMCKNHYASWYYYNGPTGTGHPRPKKDVVGYEAAHLRVRTAKGRAAEHKCVDCGKQATDWSLSADAENVLLGCASTGRPATTRYSMNIDDYFARCSKHHKAYDARTGNRSYKTGQYALVNAC